MNLASTATPRGWLMPAMKPLFAPAPLIFARPIVVPGDWLLQ
jgi:hypothetical protein